MYCKHLLYCPLLAKMRILSLKCVKESCPKIPNRDKIDKVCKTFDEISGYNSDPIEQEISLLGNTQTIGYKRTVKFINFLLTIVSVKLEPYRENSNKSFEESVDYPSNTGEELKNFIRFRNPFAIPLKNLTSIKVIFRDFAYPIISYLFILYISVKYTVMAVLQSDYDLYVDKFNLSLRDNSSRSGFCCLKKDIYVTNQDKETLTRLELARSRLEALGDPIISVHGPGTAIIGLIITLPFVVYLTSVCLTRRRRVDILSFYFNPSSEIFRIKKELSGILFRTAESINNYHKTANLKLSLNNKSSEVNHPGSNLNNFKTYTQMLFDVNLVEMVRPANLTNNWHKTLIIIEFWILSVVLTFGVAPILFLMLIMTIYELHNRVQQRLNSLECQKWATDSILIKETMKLSLLSNQKDKLAYSTYDGSISQLFQLITQVEIKYYLSIRVFISLFEICLAIGLAVTIATFFYYLYVLSFLGRIVWLKQIQEQVNWAKNQLIQFSTDSNNHKNCTKIKSEKLMINCKIKHNCRSQNAATTMKPLLIAYLNYELYRKQQPEYLKLVTFLVFQSISLVFTIALFSYFIGTRARNDLSAIFLLVMPTYLMTFVNVHLLIGAYLISRNSSLNKNILSMLAAAAANEMHLLDLIDLWRRQLLDDEGTKRNFAVKLFSVYLSYDCIMNFNAYLVALWFIVLNYRK